MTADPSAPGGSSTSRPKPSSSSSRSAGASSTSRSPGSAVRALADAYGVEPSRSLGQHFLVDPNLADAIAADVGAGPGVQVVEIGAGLGSLTTALADAGADRVLAIEFDRALIPALREAVADRPAVEVLQADATKTDWASSTADGDWVACGNLPYNVGTPIVLDLLAHAPAVARIVVMVQREVAERFLAAPGGTGYGPASLRAQYHAETALVRRVPPDVFWPRPSVASAVVRFTRRAEPPVAVDPARLWRVVDGSFAQRRKSIRKALRRLDVPDVDQALADAAVEGDRRPETLSLQEFAALVEHLPA